MTAPMGPEELSALLERRNWRPIVLEQKLKVARLTVTDWLKGRAPIPQAVADWLRASEVDRRLRPPPPPRVAS